MLKTRTITAIALLTVFLLATFSAPIQLFGALIAGVLVLAAWEWARLLGLQRNTQFVYAALIGAVLVWNMSANQAGSSISPEVAIGLYKVAAIFWLGVVPFVLIRRPLLNAGVWRWFLLAVGIMLFLAAWHALLVARTHGASFVLSLLSIVWLADSGAYFSGRQFGSRKLAPSISPGKTWEGVLGGWLLVLLVVIGVLATHAFAPNFFLAYAAHLGTVGTLTAITGLVLVSVMGDLFESLLKRQAGVKDSSNLLPGHGGILDRIDALLPTVPLAMLLF